ncbi:MAG: hypothetical protein Kow0098_01850 [Ignavibacteriaceae bacterium]
MRGDTTYHEFYKLIVENVTALGHTALCELNSQFGSAIPLTDGQIFKRDIKWIDKSELLIAEVSGASSGVGFEIAYALYSRKIPVLALANEDAKKVSAMIAGCNSDLFVYRKYSSKDDIKQTISRFIKKYSK